MLIHKPNFLRLYTFDGGRVVTQGVQFIARDGSETHRDLADPNHAYLIQHPRGLLVWDTGLSDSFAGLPDHTFVRGRFRFVVENPLATQFHALSIDPAQVDYLSFSHLQIDHAGNTGLFSHAAALIQADEYHHAFGPDAEDWGYRPCDYASLKTGEIRQILGDYDIFGDGKVILLSAPGHTPGHQVLFVDLPQSGPVLLSGDLYYATGDPEAGVMPGWNYNKEVTRQTMDRLAAFAAERGARWIINHNPDSPNPGWME